MQSLREDQLEIGAVRVSARAESLTLHDPREEGGEITLDADGVEELFRFLRSVILSPNDRRRSYRLPVPSAAGFKSTLYFGTRAIPAEARNLSLTGVLLQPVSRTELEFEQGSTLRVLLEFDGESVIADATLVRRCGSEYGLNFRNAGNGDELDPLPGLAQIMKKLEHHWAMEGWKS